MKKLLVILLSLMMLFGVFAATASAAGISFTDVKPSDWFYDDVKNAVNMGLVNGKSATTYAPNDNMTYAEATKLAACMYEKYTTGQVTLANSPTGNWYDSYVEYARANGIISGNYYWNGAASRAGYMAIFAHALPDSAFAQINNVPDNSIPDVGSYSYYGPDIYKLYRAGIVQGVDAQFNCKPDSNIKRSEVAAILTRMMDPAARKSFSTAPASALTITSQPKDAAIIMGSNATFSVAASGGTPPYKYEWHRISEGGYDWIPEDPDYFGGLGTASLTTKNCEARENGDKYYCIVTDAAGNKVTSNKATLTINAINLTVQMQKTSVTATEGGKAYFTVGVSGGYAPYSFEWHRIIKSGSFAGEDYALDDNDVFPGASTANLTVTNCAIGENGDKYYCVVTDSKGNKGTSDKATLTVKAAAAALTITSQPNNKTIGVGGDATFTVAASGGTQPYSYEWHRVIKVSNYDLKITQDETLITGTKTPSLTTKNCQSDENGDQYYCVIRDANGNSVTSSKATLTVKPLSATLPSTITAYGGVAFSGKIVPTIKYGSGSYTYEWYFKYNSDNWTKSGDKDKDYELPASALETGDKWQVYCVITDTGTNQKVTTNTCSFTVK